MSSKHSDDYAHRSADRREPVPEPRSGGNGVGSSPGAALRAAGPFLHVGIQVGLTMALTAGLGYLVDNWLGTSPWGVLLGSLLGVVAVFVVLVRLVADLNEQSAKRYGTGSSDSAKTKEERR